jgi:2-phosphoglycerate kinase
MEQVYNQYFFIEPIHWREKILSITKFLIDEKENKPLILFVGGPTGVGKSSVSIKLADLLGIRNLICTDTIRSILAVNNKESILKYFSHESWKFYGEFTKENLYKGFKLQSKLVNDSIDILLEDSIRHKKNTIIEGIHLLPSIVENKKEKFSGLNIINISIVTQFDFFINKLLPNRIVSTYRHRKNSDYNERLLIYNYFFELWNDEIEVNKSHYVQNEKEPFELVESLLNKLITILS